MAATVAHLQAVLSANTRDFDRGMDRSETKMGKVGKAAGVLGVAMAGGLAFGAKKAISAASDLNEEIDKTEVVFGASAKSVLAWSKSTAKNIGISRTESLRAAGAYGNMFKTIGLGQRPAARMSRQMVQLAADMASFSNEDPSDMLLRLRGGLAGEAEPLRQFGVLLSESRVAAEALSMGLVKANVDTEKVRVAQIRATLASRAYTEAVREHGKGSDEALQAEARLGSATNVLAKALKGSKVELTEAQKVQARYSLIMKDTAVQQGNFADTSGSLANQQRVLKAELNDLAASLGTILLPAVQEITAALAGFAAVLTQNPKLAKALTAAVVALTAALLAAKVAQLALNLAVLANPYVAATVAVVALAAGVYLLWQRVQQLRPAILFVLTTLMGLPLPLRIIISLFGEQLAGAIQTAFNTFKRFAEWVANHVTAIKNSLTGPFQALIDVLEKVWDWLGKIKSAIGGIAGKIAGGVGRGAGGPATSTTGLIPMVVNAVNMAREMGWQGVVTSGFRTYQQQAALYQRYLNGGPLAAPPGTSSHEFGQAVDVTDYTTFGQIMNRLPRGLGLKNRLGARDPVHFSVTGYDQGGWLPPGLSMAYNGTGRPERVGGGGDNHFYFPNYVGSKTELMSFMQNAARRWRRQNGKGAF